MATSLDIEPELLEQALRLSGEQTETAAVTKALREFVARREQSRIVDLFDALDRDASYDHKVERSR